MPKPLEYGLYITLFLVLFFLIRKKRKLPSKLNLTAYKDTKDKIGGLRKVTAEPVFDEEMSHNQEIFLYKGKKYNAWQVLGLPAGASEVQIKRAFVEKSQQNPFNKGLYYKAYKLLS